MPACARLTLLFLQHLPRKEPDHATRALLRWQPVLHEVFGGDGDEDQFWVALQVTKVEPEEVQELVEPILNAKRARRILFTADRLRLEGRRQGLEEGLEQGIEKGIEQGVEQGEDRATRRTLFRLLQLRFGNAASRAEPRIRSATRKQVRLWLDRTVLAGTLEDVFRAPQ